MAKPLVTDDLWRSIKLRIPRGPPQPKGGRPAIGGRAALTGIRLAVRLTGANRHDVTQLLPLVDAIPAIRGKVGHPRRKRDCLYANQAYGAHLHCMLRRVRARYERRDDIHGGFLRLGCALICWNALQHGSC